MGHRHRADKYYTTDLVNSECISIIERNEEWKKIFFLRQEYNNIPVD